MPELKFFLFVHIKVMVTFALTLIIVLVEIFMEVILTNDNVFCTAIKKERIYLGHGQFIFTFSLYMHITCRLLQNTNF